MHYLHCILVHFDESIEGPTTEETVAEEARRLAVDATDGYYNQAFDWRAEDAGSWADQYPRRGVVLGSVEPEQFITLLDEWRKKPVENALKYLEQVRADMSDSGKGLVVNEDLLNRIWESDGLWTFALHRAVALVDGDYVIESQFYSVPDGSPKICDTTLKHAEEHPEEYALVFLDYHW